MCVIPFDKVLKHFEQKQNKNFQILTLNNIVNIIFGYNAAITLHNVSSFDHDKIYDTRKSQFILRSFYLFNFLYQKIPIAMFGLMDAPERKTTCHLHKILRRCSILSCNI